MILVSACLLGQCCKYNGGHNRNAAVLDFLQGKDYLPICPETFGGLSAPRPPAELRPDGRVVDKSGRDVTAAFLAGAQKALELASAHRPELIILKSNSPSCGCGQVYDGTFSGATVPGDGVAARLLRDAGFPVCTEKTLPSGGKTV